LQMYGNPRVKDIALVLLSDNPSGLKSVLTPHVPMKLGQLGIGLALKVQFLFVQICRTCSRSEFPAKELVL
jgi:hypothetical protein